MRWWIVVVAMAGCDPCAGATDEPSFLLHIADPDGNPASPTVVSVNGTECQERDTGTWFCHHIHAASAFIVDITGEGFEYYSEPVEASETGRDDCPFDEQTEVDVVLTPTG
jgi:hypothetical protein